MNEFKKPEPKLTPTEIIIGAFSFVAGGIALIAGLLFAWDFIVTVFG